MKSLMMFILGMSTLNAYSATSEKCPGEEGYYYTNYRHTNNPTAGGFVSYSATIQDSSTIVIGKLANVCGNAIILNSANIGGTAIVRGDAEVSGSSIITGSVILEGSVKVGGKSVIKGIGTLDSGEYNDTIKTLADAQPSTPTPALSALEIATKLQNYVGKYASRFSPDTGNYESGDQLEQSIRFSNGPCRLIINKNRTSLSKNSSSVFYLTSSITFNMSDAEQILNRVYGPSLVTSNIQVPNYENLSSVSVKQKTNYADYNETYYKWRFARYMIYNDSTVESIEAPNEGHAKNIQELLVQLMKACN